MTLQAIPMDWVALAHELLTREGHMVLVISSALTFKQASAGPAQEVDWLSTDYRFEPAEQ